MSFYFKQGGLIAPLGLTHEEIKTSTPRRGKTLNKVKLTGKRTEGNSASPLDS